MTRLNTPKRINGSNGSHTVAAIHRHDGRLFVLWARKRDSGIAITDSKSFDASDLSSLSRALEQSRPDEIIDILPGGSVISRIIEVPHLDDPQAQHDAAMLQAEVEMPGTIAAHRASVAVLPWSTAAQSATALALGWPGQAKNAIEVGDPPVAVYHTGQAACLAELLIASGSDQGIIAFADHDRGSLELITHLSESISVRTANISQSDWSQALSRTMIETALSAGASDNTVDTLDRAAATAGASSHSTLISDGDLVTRLISKVAQSSADPAWWNQYGLCVGACLGALSRRASNFALLAHAPSEPSGVLFNAAHWLTQPRHATQVLIAGIVLALVIPLASAWLRYKILSLKSRDLETVKAEVDNRERTAEFYRVLNEKRWPMTKLLADLATRAHYDLDFESVYIDSNSNITLTGTAPLSQRENVNAFHRNLLESGIFSNIVAPEFKSGDNQIEFQFQLGVTGPLNSAPRQYEIPLGEVMYGDRFLGKEPGDYRLDLFSRGRGSRVVYPEGATGSDTEHNAGAGATGQPEQTPTFGIGENTDEGGTDDEGGLFFDLGAPGEGGGMRFDEQPNRPDPPRNTGTVNSRPTENTGDLPPPLSDEEIANMDMTAVNKAMIERGRLKYKDPRLQVEYDKLVQRFRELRAQGAGSPAGGGF